MYAYDMRPTPKCVNLKELRGPGVVGRCGGQEADCCVGICIACKGAWLAEDCPSNRFVVSDQCRLLSQEGEAG